MDFIPDVAIMYLSVNNGDSLTYILIIPHGQMLAVWSTPWPWSWWCMFKMWTPSQGNLSLSVTWMILWSFSFFFYEL